MSTRTILTLLFSLALCACSRYSDFRSVLDETEELMQEHPDSAYATLCSMNERAANVSTSLQMRYLLLRSNAQNKSNIPFTSDSIGSVLVEYYDSCGSSNERMSAHFVKGCAYRDMRDWFSAVSCFNEAVAAADTVSIDCDFSQLSSVYRQLGYIHSWRYLMAEDLRVYADAEQYAQDTSSVLNMWKQDYSVQMYKDEMLQSYLDAYESLSGHSLPDGDINGGIEDYYYTKGTYYNDKAVFRKSVEIKEIQIRLRNFIIVGAVLFSAIVLLMVAYRRRLRLKIVRLKREMHSQLSQNSAVVDMLNKDIEEKAQLISSLHRQLDENAVNLHESEQMKQTIGILEQQILEYKRVIDEFTKSLNSSRLQEEPAIAQFIQMAKEGKRRPDREEWQRVFVLVETHHPGMLEIRNHKDVNRKEYRICVLLKLGLDIQSIKFIENTYSSDISVVRSRLLLKIYGIKGSAKDFDSRLAEI